MAGVAAGRLGSCLLAGPWDIILQYVLAVGHHVPPQLRCSGAPVTWVTQVKEDAGSITQGGIRAAKRCFQSFLTVAHLQLHT